MKKILIALLFIMLVASQVSASTVMIYVQKIECAPETEEQVHPLYLSFESGVLSKFFDEGYITFNMDGHHSGLSPINAAHLKSLPDNFKPLKIAASSGAEYLLVVTVDIIVKDEVITCSGVDFSVVNAQSNHNVLNGNITAEEIQEIQNENNKMLFTILGRTVASQVLERW